MKITHLTRIDDHVGEGVFDSIAWALHHIKLADTREYHSAVMYGNEDAPERIDFYKEAEPTVNDKVAFRWITDLDSMSREQQERLLMDFMGNPDVVTAYLDDRAEELLRRAVEDAALTQINRQLGPKRYLNQDHFAPMVDHVMQKYGQNRFQKKILALAVLDRIEIEFK